MITRNDLFNAIQTYLSKKRAFYFLFCLIFLVSLVVFHPSFFHVFRGEHILYLAETHQYDDLVSLCKNFYAYEHVRKYFKGDTLTLRPLFFVLLGVEKWLFGTQYAYWHITGFLIHMLAVWFLLKLLVEINRSIFAFLLAGLFAFSYSIVEAIVSEHINAYALFVAFVLGSLYHLYKYVKEAERNKVRLIGVFIFMLLACFLYENGILFSILFAVYLLTQNKKAHMHIEKRWILLLLLPALIYLGVYVAVDIHHNNPSLMSIKIKERQEIFNYENVKLAAQTMPALVGYMFYHGCFPALIEGKLPLDLGEKIIYQYPYGIISLRPPAIINYLAVFILFISFLLCISKNNVKRTSYLMALLAGMILCFVAVICVGRTTTHGIKYIIYSISYYSYMFWAYFCILFYAAADWGIIEKRWKGMLGYSCVLAFTILICVNCYKTYLLNRHLAEEAYPTFIYTNWLNRFINTNRHEPDFSFFIPQDVNVKLIVGHPRHDKLELTSLSLSEILYYRYVDKENPKYLLLYNPTGEIFSVHKVKKQ